MNKYFTPKLIETTFLFCYRRVANKDNAQDLSEEIICDALKAVRSGKEIHHFYSWYWQLAHNKYAQYIIHKKDPALPLEHAYGVSAEIATQDEGLVREDEISFLNSTLSRLGEEYRTILVKYYLREESIAQIANELHIPQGTVKGRLFDARKTIKGRMTKMENKHIRRTGTQAYAPVKLDYYCTGWCRDAFNVLKDLIPQQIAVNCRMEKKSTVELSAAIGIPVVYLQEQIDKMLSAQVLTEVTAGKYLTMFNVFPFREYQKTTALVRELCSAQSIPEKICNALLSVEQKIKALTFYGNVFAYNDLLWFLLPQTVFQFMEACMQKLYDDYNIQQPAEAERRIHITSQYIMPEEQFTDSQSIRNRREQSECAPYKTDKYGIVWFNDMLFRKNHDRLYTNDGTAVSLLMLLSNNPAEKLNRHEEETAAIAASKGLLTKTNDGLCVNVPVFTDAVFLSLKTILTAAIRPIADAYAESVRPEIEKILLPFVRKDRMRVFAYWDMPLFCNPVQDVIQYASDAGLLTVPDDYNRSAVGIYLLQESTLPPHE